MSGKGNKSVTVKDVASDKFIAAYAELLKRSGKVDFDDLYLPHSENFYVWSCVFFFTVARCGDP